jgi:hypothetical protein
MVHILGIFRPYFKLHSLMTIGNFYGCSHETVLIIFYYAHIPQECYATQNQMQCPGFLRVIALHFVLFP